MGVREFIKAVEHSKAGYERAFAAALYQEGLALHAASVPQVPVEYGRLRASGYVSPPTGVDNPEVEVGYGTDYAVYVHERTELRHKVGKAKFLSDPMNERQNGYAERLAKRTQQNFERGVGMDAIPKTAPSEPER
jgi:hypothetical protein